MSILYSIFDQSNLGTGLQLSNSNQVVTTTLPGLDIHRQAGCLYSMDDFGGNVEWLAFGTAALSTTNYAVGVTTAFALNKYVGEDAASYGLKSDGHLYNNNASVASSGTTIARNDIVSMVYNPVGLLLQFYKNGNLILTYALPNNGPWFPAVSLGSTAVGDLSIFFNAGQQSFQFPIGGFTGWWIQSAAINPVRLASEDFTGPTTDTVPNSVWDGAVNPVSNNGSNLRVVRGVSFWPWRTQSASLSGGQSYGSLTIDDPNQVYNSLLTLDVRDAPIQILRAQAQQYGGSVDTAQVIATGVIDRVDTAGDFQKTVYIKDALAILDTPVQRSLFLPNVVSSAVGHPLPIVAGACRSVPGILINSATPYTLQFTDSPMAQLGGPLVAGKLAVAGIDFTLTADARSCAFDATLYPNGPQGKVTADISTVGGSVIGLTDLLSAAGSASGTASGTNTYAVTLSPAPGSYVAGAIYTVTFTNGNTGASTLNANGLGAKAIQLNGSALVSGDIPAGAVLNLLYDGTQLQIIGNGLGGIFNTYSSTHDLDVNWGTGGYLANRPTWTSTNGGQLELGLSAGSGEGTFVYTKWNACRSGYTYVAEISINSSPAVDPKTTLYAYISVGTVLTYAVGAAFVYNPIIIGIIPPHPWAPLTVRLTFTNTTASAAPFVLSFQPNNVAGTADIKYVKLYELPLATSAVNLSGMNLQDYLTLMIQTEGGLSASVWASGDAAAIDTATGYKSFGNYIAQSTTIRNACQPVLDSCGCDFFIDRSGLVRTVQFVDPATLVSQGTIDENVILGPVAGGSVEAGVTIGASQNSMIAMSPDLAPGLTTKAGARPNQSVWTQGDITATLAQCPNTVRALLTQPYQSIAASGVQLSNSYRYAQQAAPLRTCFDDPAEALTEITRINNLYTQLRYFYYVPVKSDETDAYEIGQGWQLKYPRYDLDSGKPVMIVGITENPITEQLTLVCWG